MNAQRENNEEVWAGLWLQTRRRWKTLGGPRWINNTSIWASCLHVNTPTTADFTQSNSLDPLVSKLILSSPTSSAARWLLGKMAACWETKLSWTQTMPCCFGQHRSGGRRSSCLICEIVWSCETGHFPDKLQVDFLIKRKKNTLYSWNLHVCTCKSGGLAPFSSPVKWRIVAYS